MKDAVQLLQIIEPILSTACGIEYSTKRSEWLSTHIGYPTTHASNNLEVRVGVKPTWNGFAIRRVVAPPPHHLINLNYRKYCVKIKSITLSLF